MKIKYIYYLIVALMMPMHHCHSMETALTVKNTVAAISKFVQLKKAFTDLTRIYSDDSISTENLSRETLKALNRALDLEQFQILSNCLNIKKLKQSIATLIDGGTVSIEDITQALTPDKAARAFGSVVLCHNQDTYFSVADFIDIPELTRLLNALIHRSEPVNLDVLLKLEAIREHLDYKPAYFFNWFDIRELLLNFHKLYKNKQVTLMDCINFIIKSLDIRHILVAYNLSDKIALFDEYFDLEGIHELLCKRFSKEDVTREEVRSVIKMDKLNAIFDRLKQRIPVALVRNSLTVETIACRYINPEECVLIIVDYLSGKAISKKAVDKAINLQSIETDLGLPPATLDILLDPETPIPVQLGILNRLQQNYQISDSYYTLLGLGTACALPIGWQVVDTACHTCVEAVEPESVACGCFLATAIAGLTYYAQNLCSQAQETQQANSTGQSSQIYKYGPALNLYKLLITCNNPLTQSRNKSQQYKYFQEFIAALTDDNIAALTPTGQNIIGLAADNPRLLIGETDFIRSLTTAQYELWQKVLACMPKQD